MLTSPPSPHILLITPTSASLLGPNDFLNLLFDFNDPRLEPLQRLAILFSGSVAELFFGLVRQLEADETPEGECDADAETGAGGEVAVGSGLC